MSWIDDGPIMRLFGGNSAPDPARGYVAGINADLESLPARRLIEALAILGERGTVNMPGRGDQVFDFTGLGEADYQRIYGDRMAQELLQIQRDFGPQYVEQRLRELEASDPQGAAMRRQLWASIKTSSDTLTDRPQAEALQRLVLEDLERAGELNPETEERISQRVLGGQVARGNFLGNAAATEEASALTQASEQQLAQRQQQALAFLTGGLSPEDAAYREQQQDLANIGAFMAGETPTAQFSQLSGAANGAAPFTTSGPLPGVNPNAGWLGVQNQQNQWSLTNQLQQNQVNPWLAGFSGAANGFNVGMNWNLGGGRVTTDQAVQNIRAAY